VIIVERGRVRWNYEVKSYAVNFALVPMSRLLYKDLKLLLFVVPLASLEKY